MVGGQPKEVLIEAARERETFRYDTCFIPACVQNDTNNLIPSSQLRSCFDPALTAFAQLGTLRLGASRALISLFDSKFQYVIAEATPTLPLVPNATTGEGSGDDERLWLCGTALPRDHGLCEQVLLKPRTHKNISSKTPLPVSVITDLTTDPRSSEKSQHKEWPRPRFYAGVPIQTNKGVNIGVFSIWADEPRQELDPVSMQVMRGLSKTIIQHLDAKRSGEGHRRAVRMVRGMGSFVEGKATISGASWSRTGSQDEDPSLEGALNENQQQIQDNEDARVATQESTSASTSHTSSPIPSPKPLPSMPHRSRRRSLDGSGSERSVTSASPGADLYQSEVRHIFSKASNIIREAIEVEGAVFLDASIGSFAGLATKAVPSGSTSSSASSGDEKASNAPAINSDNSAEPDVPCRILAHSNSISSSIDTSPAPGDYSDVSEKFLHKLLKRYPEGRIFSFDENGSLQTSDFSDEDPKALSPLVEDQIFQPPVSERARKRNRRLLSRRNEGKMIMSLFSGARSVALVPIWDGQKQRWFAGGFVYTKTPTRVLTIEGELSYLKAFGSVIMAEVSRSNSKMVDKAKSDLLSSLSHELRSPLHGILLGSELLHETTLDAFQGDVLHSVETCGHTLLDTMDHLLDYSKLGNFLRPTSKQPNKAPDFADRGLRSNDKKLTIEAGMIALERNCAIDVLSEEVIESVCAGFSFQRFAVGQLAGSRPSEHADTDALRRLDGMQALENMASENNRTGDAQLLLGEVSVTFDINPAMNWRFYSQPGALRRILMNILGNSLKYTSKGFINVNVLQLDGPNPNSREIHIVVTDSGKGISEDYMSNHLFSPFYQEDTLSAGTGLGLSLVKEVVRRLGGSIRVESKAGRGTRVTIKLPLQEAGPPSPKTSIPKAVNFDEFRAQVSELKGLRARLLGFPSEYNVPLDEDLSSHVLSEGELIANVCRQWLQMQVIDESAQGKKVMPDCILSTERHLDRLLFERRHGIVATPVVIVCRNALIARQLATSPRFTGKRVVFEFISQPIGPRKLARILLLSFRRWTKLQASVIQTPTAMSLVSAGHSNADYGDMSWLQQPTSTSAVSTDAVADRTEYFDAADIPPEGPLRQIQHQEKARPSIMSLAERPYRSSTPTPAHPESDTSPVDVDGSSDLFLLVDDNQINLKILSSYMKKLGHKYTTAMDGKQALDAFVESAGRYKCIFMDISMPVMDGFEATREVRVFETKKNLPRCQIFALTGLASAGAQEEAFASGIDLFLTKPVKLKELSKILETKDLA
ncbi:sensor histidine kinase response [Colletotrichum truncatum]|uniref:Sensor histidine kinase response n=1 Tax=Colletotrichum truncatum TaxID=5467 RepID=A0ACC3YJX5_COLTU|nr:sensor histidine kinase response [Colletotrichum truncatum]KAF6797445.1 sensor histidine kinase response [Colletotrichum truncatum]